MPASPEDRTRIVEVIEDAGVDMRTAEKIVDRLYDEGFTISAPAAEEAPKSPPFGGKETPEEEGTEAERMGEAGEEMPESYDARKKSMKDATGIAVRFAFGRMKKGAKDRKKFREDTEEPEEGEAAKK